MKETADLEPVLRKAFAIATTGRPGPVLVDVPRDVQVRRAAFPATPRHDWTRPSYRPAYDPDEIPIAQAVAMIEAGERPILYVGGGVINAGAEPWRFSAFFIKARAAAFLSLLFAT